MRKTGHEYKILMGSPLRNIVIWTTCNWDDRIRDLRCMFRARKDRKSDSGWNPTSGFGIKDAEQVHGGRATSDVNGMSSRKQARVWVAPSVWITYTCCLVFRFIEPRHNTCCYWPIKTSIIWNVTNRNYITQKITKQLSMRRISYGYETRSLTLREKHWGF
jgi:hypothetical protein